MAARPRPCASGPRPTMSWSPSTTPARARPTAWQALSQCPAAPRTATLEWGCGSCTSSTSTSRSITPAMASPSGSATCPALPEPPLRDRGFPHALKWVAPTTDLEQCWLTPRTRTPPQPAPTPRSDLWRQLPWPGLRERGAGGGGRRRGGQVVGEDPARVRNDPDVQHLGGVGVRPGGRVAVAAQRDIEPGDDDPVSPADLEV